MRASPRQVNALPPRVHVPCFTRSPQPPGPRSAILATPVPLEHLFCRFDAFKL